MSHPLESPVAQEPEAVDLIPDLPAVTPAPEGAENPELADKQLEVYDYLNPQYRRYGMQEMAGVQAISYFLPLLHELFNGSEGRAKVVFTLLHGLMRDDRVRWTRQEIDDKFHWLKDGHRNYFLHRLSNVGFLEYLRDQGVYMISDKGEALMRMLSRFTLGSALVENEGAALAEIEFSILLEVDDLSDRLKFLRNRLLKHSLRADQALKSESAYRILEIYQQLQSAYRWAEQTRETLDHLEIDDENAEQWDAVRAVHDHLSTLHSLISKMQLVLQDIQRKQIDIARYGLTHLDFDNYLINSRPDAIAELMKRHLRKIPHPFFVQDAAAFAEAAHVLGRVSTESEAARGWDTDVTAADPHGERLAAIEAEDFVRDLVKAPRKSTPIAFLIQDHSWEIAAYRFSLLTMLADREARSHLHGEDRQDPFINVPAEADFDPDGAMMEFISNGETWAMTRGNIRSLPVPKPEPVAVTAARLAGGELPAVDPADPPPEDHDDARGKTQS